MKNVFESDFVGVNLKSCESNVTESVCVKNETVNVIVNENEKKPAVKEEYVQKIKIKDITYKTLNSVWVGFG